MFIKQEYQPIQFHLLAEGPQEKYIYEDNGNAIAKLNLHLNGQSLYIANLDVQEQHQRKGWGTKIVSELFEAFPQITLLHGNAEKDVMENFWSKQKGFRFAGEGHDELEGGLFFEIHK